MKIKKLYLQNFKWVEWAKIIDFDKDIVFLTGPNGYGKTTVFDAIEICLTGELCRIQKLKVQDNKKRVEKAYYHNNINNKVVLKLSFELEEGFKKMIIAYDAWVRSSTKPKDLYFDFYLCDYVENIFYDDFPKNFPNWLNIWEKLDKGGLLSKINQIFKIEKGNFLDIYKIFHYLQQEETTFFLKKSEYERKNSLNFLFWTEKEAKRQEKIKDFERDVADYVRILDTEIMRLKEKIDEGVDISTEKIKYNQIFWENDIIKTKQFSFDNEELFDNKKSIDENRQFKMEYLNNCWNIKNFLANFSSKEYRKYVKKKKIEKIQNDVNFQKCILLQNFFPKVVELQKYDEYNRILQTENSFEMIQNYHILSDKKIKKEYEFYNKIEQNQQGYSFSYFVLKNIIGDKNIIEWQKFKNELISISEVEIENCIFSSDVKEKIKIQNNILQKISNPKWVASILLQNFLETEKYENFQNSFHENMILLEFLNKSIEDKYREIEKIAKILWNHDDFLVRFQSFKKRKDDLEKDIWENDKIVSLLNALREDLFSRYKIQFLWKNNFDNSCFFCGAKEINGESIKNIEHFKEFFDEKTQIISNISQWKTIEIEEVNRELQKLLNIFEKNIWEYLLNKEFQSNNNIFEKISKYEAKLFFDEHNAIIKDFPQFALQEIPENLDEKIENLLSFFKKESEKYWFFNNKISQNYELHNCGILEKFIKQQKIDIFLDIKNITIEKFSQKKEEILEKIKIETNWFDKSLFTIIEKNFENYDKNKSWIALIQDLLWEDYKKFVLSIDDMNFVSFEDKAINLKNAILKRLQSSYDKFGGVKYLEENFVKNQEKLWNLKIFLETLQIEWEEKIREIIKNRAELYNELRLLSDKNISQEVEDMIGISSKKYILQEFDDFGDLNERMKWFQKEITGIILNFNIDDKKIGWEQYDFVKILFNENIDLIEKYQKKINLFEEKQKYIEYKFFECQNIYKQELWKKLDIYKERKNILEKFQSKQLSDLYNWQIQKYKENIVKSIQIPFFLYTARIIQNFWQWLGIFISIQTKWKDGNDLINESVTFSVWGEKVDIMHQLSSGQLAVIAIAFLLSVNKVYNRFKYWKFILIDDPIQEMDSLNIHSFIELIKYNFIWEFFMIMSTHNDDKALFMKYKIEQIPGNEVKMINIQREFYE